MKAWGMDRKERVIVRPVRDGDYLSWLDLRVALWPHCSEAEHREEMNEWLSKPEIFPVFVAAGPSGALLGFLEVSVHPADERYPGPVVYLEGWYVRAEDRRLGVGGALVTAAEAWAMAQGFVRVGSDTERDNLIGIAAHQRLGYRILEENEAEVVFTKALDIGQRLG